MRYKISSFLLMPLFNSHVTVLPCNMFDHICVTFTLRLCLEIPVKVILLPATKHDGNKNALHILQNNFEEGSSLCMFLNFLYTLLLQLTKAINLTKITLFWYMTLNLRRFKWRLYEKFLETLKNKIYIHYVCIFKHFIPDLNNSFYLKSCDWFMEMSWNDNNQ